ncbi:hypothetical protein GQR58_009939 [Nymphon striatum]|nr:hypothetical protein GQR58_009939 [Nymphon striatum]
MTTSTVLRSAPATHSRLPTQSSSHDLQNLTQCHTLSENGTSLNHRRRASDRNLNNCVLLVSTRRKFCQFLGIAPSATTHLRTPLPRFALALALSESALPISLTFLTASIAGEPTISLVSRATRSGLSSSKGFPSSSMTLTSDRTSIVNEAWTLVVWSCYLLETFWLLLGAFQEVQPCPSSEQESTWHSSCGPWHGTNMPILPNMNMFEEKRISLLKIHHFVKNGGNRGFLNEISWGFFFGHSSYKTEPSEKISAGHDLFPGYTLERLDY